MARGTSIVLTIMLLLSLSTPISTHATVQEYSWTRSCSVHIVAVSSSGGGVAGNLTVRVAYPGSGKVYISTSPASMVDTQGSARIAAFAASLLAGVDMTRYDFFYDVQSNSIIIGGPSAGFAMALATLMALENVTCRSDFALTGMIQPDTSIGPVGGLKEKLEAAASVGAKLFLIPAGQEVYTYYQTKYERIGPFIKVERVPVTVNLTEYGSKLGVRVVSIATLEDGFRVITNKSLTSTGVNLTIPVRVSEAVKGFVEWANKTVGAGLDSIQNKDNGFVKALSENATSKLKESAALLEEGRIYQAAISAVSALEYAYTAEYADTALASDYKVTPVVDDVNATINKVYSELVEAGRGNLTPVQVETLAKAWAKLGIGAYYFQGALKSLSMRGGDYYLPITLGGVDLAPLVYLGEARALAVWAEFWFNLSSTVPVYMAKPVEASRLNEVSRLLEAEARSATAYLQTILDEAGADTSRASLPLFLAEQALTIDDPIARIGFSIESIALTTTVIHETFTLDPARTAAGLTSLALTLYKRLDGGSIQIPLLVSLAMQGSSSSKTPVLASSRAVLYGWLTWELSSQTSSISTPASTTTTTHTGSNTTATTTSSMGGSSKETGGGVSAAYPLALALTAVVSLMLGVVVGWLALRE